MDYATMLRAQHTYTPPRYSLSCSHVPSITVYACLPVYSHIRLDNVSIYTTQRMADRWTYKQTQQGAESIVLPMRTCPCYATLTATLERFATLEKGGEI